jgi:hypothetical protein
MLMPFDVIEMKISDCDIHVHIHIHVDRVKSLLVESDLPSLG